MSRPEPKTKQSAAVNPSRLLFTVLGFICVYAAFVVLFGGPFNNFRLLAVTILCSLGLFTSIVAIFRIDKGKPVLTKSGLLLFLQSIFAVVAVGVVLSLLLIWFIHLGVE